MNATKAIQRGTVAVFQTYLQEILISRQPAQVSLSTRKPDVQDKNTRPCPNNDTTTQSPKNQ